MPTILKVLIGIALAVVAAYLIVLVALLFGA